MGIAFGNTYISWRPKVPKSGMGGALAGAVLGRECEHSSNVSLVQDLKEAGYPELRVDIYDGVLNEEKMELWWKGYAISNIENRKIKKRDATTIHKALKAGGGPEYRYGENQVYSIVEYLDGMRKKLGNDKFAFGYRDAGNVQEETVITNYGYVGLTSNDLGDALNDEIFFGR
jgi:hypothetical protein